MGYRLADEMCGKTHVRTDRHSVHVFRRATLIHIGKEVRIIPVFRMESSWGIVNTGSIWLTRLSVVLPQIAGNLSFAIIVLMGFIRSLPVDLEEAAYLEGYNVYQIFFRIIMPLAKPSFATVGIFTFLWSYNDLFLQMFFHKLYRGVQQFIGERTVLVSVEVMIPGGGDVFLRPILG